MLNENRFFDFKMITGSTSLANDIKLFLALTRNAVFLQHNLLLLIPALELYRYNGHRRLQSNRLLE